VAEVAAEAEVAEIEVWIMPDMIWQEVAIVAVIKVVEVAVALKTTATKWNAPTICAIWNILADL
jgi:hypothetical protein